MTPFVSSLFCLGGKKGIFKKTNLNDKIHFFFFLKHRSCLHSLYSVGFLLLIPCKFIATCVVFTTRHKRLQLTHVTQYSESLTIISFSWTFFHRNWLLPQVLDTKKIIKIEGQRCPFEPPNRGLAMKFKRNWKP